MRIDRQKHPHGWTGSGSAVFLSLGTSAVPKPRRRASRRPRPAPEGTPSWTPIPLALAFTLRAAFPIMERIPVQFAQHPSDCVPGSSPCVNTAGLGGGLNTLNTRGTSCPLSRCSGSPVPNSRRSPLCFRPRRASSCLANKNACIRDAWTSALGRCRSGHGQGAPSDVLTKSHPSARASFMLP